MRNNVWLAYPQTHGYLLCMIEKTWLSKSTKVSVDMTQAEKCWCIQMRKDHVDQFDWQVWEIAAIAGTEKKNMQKI